ncbi:MAG: bifunctional UDP-3-O-[3-hydroxymyristoyl] N-acetylglucosamine deacetylase/3-hydroxyacyl-ACP dehydratase [Candidatus Omnitrophica bacterium]|nr:bifunctional UDP-3-O-[3-hydroxymyristoyl] N-acetylglucosamine deacetylase/3-hydroxyacyl-ACP dehydratase [Candidatus Omnitrophota bacterium]
MSLADPQCTIANDVVIHGVGIHTGVSVSLRLLPAPADAGIVFVRTDLPHRPAIPVKSAQMVDVDKSVRRTTLSKDGVVVQTVEHFMAALWGAGIDNAYVEVTGPEVPGLDGSAIQFLEQFRAAGTTAQELPRRYVILREPIHVEDGEASITLVPDRTLRVSYLLNYPHPLLKSQMVTFAQDGADLFAQTIAPARTFCLKEEAEALRAAGFGKGANFDNTLVLDERGVMNNTLRFEDECARHKVLDLLGDLYLLGAHLRARVIAIRSGHPLNVKLLKKLTQAMEQWKIGSLQSASSEVMVGPQLDITQIEKILPHRYPFLLVDRVTELTETRAVGIKCVTINDYFFRGHFPGRPVMPGVLMIEAMAQVAGIIMLNKQENLGKFAYFMAVDKVKFRKPVVPGDVLVLEAELGKLRSRTGTVAARALVEGKVVCEGELMFALSD